MTDLRTALEALARTVSVMGEDGETPTKVDRKGVVWVQRDEAAAIVEREAERVGFWAALATPPAPEGPMGHRYSPDYMAMGDARAEGLDGRPAGWSATWRDDVTGAGLTRDEAIAALVDLAREHAALERYYLRLRDTGLAMFPDSAWLLVEGDTIRLNRTAAEAFSVALAEAPAARRTPEAARG